MRREAAAAMLLLGPVVAMAGPPYATDDPVPTERGHWEIYHFVGGSHVDGATGGEAGLDFNYGGAEDLQLTLVLPLAWEHVGRTRVGAGTVELAAKYRVVKQDAGAVLDVAVFPRVLLPTAGSGFGDPGNVSALLPVWIGRADAPWSWFAGGGYLIDDNPGRRGSWNWGAALTRSLSERLTMGAELYGRGPDADDAKSFVGANLGVVWQTTPHWALLASLGPGLVHARDEGRYAFYASMLYTR